MPRRPRVPRPAAPWLPPEATVPPEHAQVARDAAQALKDGRPAEVEMLCRLACEKGPENGDLRARQAVALCRLGRWREAWSSLRERLRSEPEEPALLTAMGSLHLDCTMWMANDPSSSIRRVKEPEKLPSDLRARWNVARSWCLRPGRRDPEGLWLVLEALTLGVEPVFGRAARGVLRTKLQNALSPAGLRALRDLFDWGGDMPVGEFLAMHNRKMQGHPDTPLVALTKLKLVMPADVFGALSVHVVPGIGEELKQAVAMLVP